MKKLITKYWGLAIVFVLIASLFVAAAPVSAANYAFSADLSQPSAVNGKLQPAAGFGFNDVAQSGTTVYAVGTDTAGTGLNYLYKSMNGGESWIPTTATFIPNVAATDIWSYVAVSPDDANFVCVVDNIAADIVYVSTNGGATFSALPASAGLSVINSISVSPAAPFRYIAIGGNSGAGVSSVQYWTIGLLAGAWTAIAPPVGIDDVMAVQFSPNFAADMGLLVVDMDNSVAFSIQVEVYSFNLVAYNPVGYNFPRRLMVDSALAAEASARASIALDPNFYLGDESTQIGFIGAQITDSALGEIGGIWRFDYAAGGARPLTKILGSATTGIAINSVAWDGTNVMAGVRAAGPIVIERSANALSVVPSWLANSALKTPGTGTLPLVYFNSGNGYCLSFGPNSGVARTKDNGKSFNGIALLNTNMGAILDYWVSPDGAQTYVLTDDGVDLNLWSKTTVWERVMIIAAGTTQTWIVRADKDVPNTVYVVRQAATTVYKSLDGGQAAWVTRATSVAIRDFVVQDANTIYASVNGAATVIKSTNGAFTWSFPNPTGLALFGNNINSLTAIGDDKLVAGGTAGFVAYTADGATWSVIPAAVGAGAMLATATGFATGDTVWAVDAAGGAGSIANWVIGTNTPITGWNLAPTVPGSCDGIAYVNGALWVLDSGANLYKFLYPTGDFGVIFGTTDTIATALVYTAGGTTTINALQYTTGSTTLVVRSIAATDAMMSYTSYLAGPTDAPVPTKPINAEIVPVNSLNGGVQTFTFMWNASPTFAKAPGQLYTYDVNVYLDELGTIVVAAGPGVVALSPFGQATAGSAAVGGFAALAQPGTTYYWRVRVSANGPEQSYWSAMQSFSIQQLQAIVPTLSSPANGAMIANGLAPAFSWNPIASAATYKFELSADPQFATTLYSAVTPTAGMSIPVSVTLVTDKNYFWRVKVLTPAEGEWSAVANFSIAAPVIVTTAPPQVTPTLTVVVPPATTTSIVITQPAPVENTVNPSYIWAIIIIGAVLVIAVIVLIVRTRRSV